MSSRLKQTKNVSVIVNSFSWPNLNFTLSYFGIQDVGSYGDIQRVLIYYRLVAQGYEEELVACQALLCLKKVLQAQTVEHACVSLMLLQLLVWK